jgi:hypothetical protein
VLDLIPERLTNQAQMGHFMIAHQLGYRCEPFSYTFLVKNRNSFPESAIKLPIMEKLAILIWLSLPGQISFPQHRFCRHTVNALYEDVGLETGS